MTEDTETAAPAKSPEVCPNCGHHLAAPALVCPRCFGRLEARCEDCGAPLVVHPKRVRVANGVRLVLTIAGIVLFVFTIGSTLGPLLGVALVIVAQFFGYDRLPHYYCATCRKYHKTPPRIR